MKTVSVSATITTIATASRARRFLHIYNNGGATVYLKYDGGALTLTTSTGTPLADGEALFLDRETAQWGATAIIGASTNELRVQGAD